MTVQNESEFLEELERIAGQKFVGDWSCYWRYQFRENPDKCERALAALKSETRTIYNPGAYLAVKMRGGN